MPFIVLTLDTSLILPQTTTDPAVLQALCRGLTSLLTRAHNSPQAVRNFTSQHLPGILQCLQAFSGAAASLQAMVLPIVAQCLVHFTASCSHNAATLKKWAWSSLFSSHLPLSQVSPPLPSFEGILILLFPRKAVVWWSCCVTIAASNGTKWWRLS